MTAAKTRLDACVVDRGMAPTRTRAKALIMAGRILVDGQPMSKPGTLVANESQVTLKGEDIPYVSRGGLKLEAALKGFSISVAGKVCLDVGASTGGFTDCLLQHGAKHVFAVDVGYGQLAWSLRQDARVTSIERTNIRQMSEGALPFPADLATVDTSFISLRIVVPAMLKWLAPASPIIALIKPQFEVGRENVGKGGVVRDPDLHADVIASLKSFFGGIGLIWRGVIPSPILGPKGNREFLVWMEKGLDASG